jgi:hypothetical protein
MRSVVDVGCGHQARYSRYNQAAETSFRDSEVPVGASDTDNNDFEALERVVDEFWQSRAGAP